LLKANEIYFRSDGATIHPRQTLKIAPGEINAMTIYSLEDGELDIEMSDRQLKPRLFLPVQFDLKHSFEL
jgi:hypothetical protein